MINKLHGKPKGQCRMDNLETHATLGTKTQSEDKKKTRQKTKQIINTDPLQKSGGEPSPLRKVGSSCFL